MNKNYAEDDKDPYVYTSGTVIRGNNNRRRLDEDVSKLASLSPTYSMISHKPTESVPPFRSFIKIDESLPTGRRRAYTEMDDLLAHDMKEIDAATLKRNSTPPDLASKKRSIKDQILRRKPQRQAHTRKSTTEDLTAHKPRRKLSMDDKHSDKQKNLELRNHLKNKLNSWLNQKN
jgi:hypothetical protein